jgi:hypothetical protein
VTLGALFAMQIGLHRRAQARARQAPAAAG